MAKKVQINVDINTKDGVKNVGDLNNEFKESLTNLNQMENASEKLTEQLKKTDVGTEAYEKLKNELMSVNREIKNQELAMEALDMDQMSSEFGSFAAGLADTATGAIALTSALGLTNESSEEMIETLVSGMAIAQTFRGGLDGIISAQKLLKNSTIASTVATKGGTVATRIFNAVVKANPIGLLVTAVLAAVAAFTLYSAATDGTKDSVEDLEYAQKLLNDRLERQNELIKRRKELETDNVKLKISKEQLQLEGRLLTLNQQMVKLKRDESTSVDDLIKKQREIGRVEESLAIAKSKFRKKQLEDSTDEFNKTIANNQEEYNQVAGFGRDLTTREQKQADDIQDVITTNKQELDNINEELNNNDIERSNNITKIRIANEQKIYDLRNSEKTEDTTEDEVKKNELALLQTTKILADERVLHVEHNKQLAIIEASKIEDEEERQIAIANVKQHYLDEETEAVKNAAFAQVELLEAQKDIDLKNAKDDLDERKRIEAKFNSDREQIYRDTELKIQELSDDTLIKLDEQYQTQLEEWLGKNGEMIAMISEQVVGMTEVISDVFSTINENAAIRREQLYEQETESLNAQLANREISQIEFDNKMKLLEQKKEQEEMAAKRKAFRQEKAMNIVSAVMNTAQAALAAYLAGLSVGGPVGLVLGPVMAGVAGAIGAAQIGVISSQKFKAARGGIVPGNGPSHIDSVDAVLAPGEAVINANSASMFPSLLSDINEAGGGISLAPDVQETPTQTESVFSDNRQNQTLKAVVVESDITDSQRRISRIERSASFG